MGRKARWLSSNPFSVFNRKLTPLFPIMNGGREIQYQQSSQNGLTTCVKVARELLDDLVGPRSGFVCSRHHRRRQEYIGWRDDCTSDMVTKYLQRFLFCFGLFLQITNPTSVQENVRQLVDHSKDPAKNGVFDIYSDDG